MIDRRFGFRQIPDSRDMLYSMPLLMGTAPIQRPDIKRWKPGPILDQGSEGSCAGQAVKQLLQSEPFQQMGGPSALDIYYEARKIDEFPDTIEGTSVRAALQVARNMGLIQSFHWAPNLESILDWLDRAGPVDVGTDWFSYQTLLDYQVTFEGRPVGGHSYLLTGYDIPARRLIMVNSWGESYGFRGEGWIAFSDMERLLSRGGVAAGVVERT